MIISKELNEEVIRVLDGVIRDLDYTKPAPVDDRRYLALANTVNLRAKLKNLDASKIAED